MILISHHRGRSSSCIMMRMGMIVAALVLGSGGALAEAPPCPQIKIIVPFSAGGASDLVARIVAEPLGAALKKTVVIENRVGATGNIGRRHGDGTRRGRKHFNLNSNQRSIESYGMVKSKNSNHHRRNFIAGCRSRHGGGQTR